MDAATALKRLTDRAEVHIEADEKARTALAEALANAPATDLTMQIDGTFRESANATPWRQLMKRVERHGVREGLAKQKAEVLEVLLSYGMGMSTSMVANSARLAEQDGLRRFLDVVDTIEIDEDSDLAGTPVEVPETTEGQRAVLRAIKETGVVLKEAHVLDGGVRTENRQGTTAPTPDRIDWAVRQGWAVVDTSAELREGQAVTLTSLGEAIIAG
ncbi:hypothetical protein E0L36_22070 [Streptomyces sp. AJS327]|uniref:hypothetical protein n=1 Tax=Streptomyces sp. AJS327 TaxID=2545265 RepID=UPI0015DFAABD|nr:hypothetical protein [Streptomyces sp. AJS327]MBA0053464.1 hypothetical protein [Streptomyces sp. AJS327]